MYSICIVCKYPSRSNPRVLTHPQKKIIKKNKISMLFLFLRSNFSSPSEKPPKPPQNKTNPLYSPYPSKLLKKTFLVGKSIKILLPLLSPSFSAPSSTTYYTCTPSSTSSQSQIFEELSLSKIFEQSKI